LVILPVRVEVYASEATVEIFVEPDSETLPEERRRFALINVPARSSAKRWEKPLAALQEEIARRATFASSFGAVDVETLQMERL
jgi:hypothetical protein